MSEETYTLKNGKSITIGSGQLVSASEHEEIERLKAEPKAEEPTPAQAEVSTETHEVEPPKSE